MNYDSRKLSHYPLNQGYDSAVPFQLPLSSNFRSCADAWNPFVISKTVGPFPGTEAGLVGMKFHFTSLTGPLVH